MDLAAQPDIDHPGPELQSVLRQTEKTYGFTFKTGKSIKRQLYEMIEQAFRQFPREGAKRAARIQYCAYYEDHVFPLELFDSYTELPFEGIRVPAPKDSDAYLRLIYGDYSKRVIGGNAHEYPYFEKMERQLDGALEDGLPFLYHFRPDAEWEERSAATMSSVGGMVLFIVSRAARWEEMRLFYEREKAQGADVTVLVIPYYQRDGLGAFRTQLEESALYPMDLPVVTPAELSLEGRVYDRIYMQDPFDACNYAFSVPTEYYSSELIKHTGQLIYVSPYRMKREYTQNSVARKALEGFVYLPGVISADLVYVASEEERNAYLDILTEKCGEEFRERFAEKILVTPLKKVRKLSFPAEYFQSEVRCDFTVGELMKRCWAVQMQVLRDVEDLCRRHGIRYFANAGTLLGAVRHLGFIPWDDDLDICMLAEDYARFLYYAQLELVGDENEGLLHLHNVYTKPEFELGFLTRLTNGTTMSYAPERLEEWFGCPVLAGIDIFPYSYLPRDPEQARVIRGLLDRVYSLMKLYDRLQELQKAGKDVEAGRAGELLEQKILELQDLTGYTFTGDRPFPNQCAILLDQICRITEEAEADEVTRLDIWFDHPTFRFPKECFAGTQTVPFENITIEIPLHAEECLTVMYGADYGVFRRFTSVHDYPYYGKQIRVIGNRLEERDVENRISGDIRFQPSAPAPGRKEILYYVGVREMLVGGEEAIAQIRRTLDSFRKRRDRYVIRWMKARFTWEGEGSLPLTEVVPGLIAEYEKLTDGFRREVLGILEESGDLQAAAEACDLYYGDESLLADQVRKLGKPVVLQDLQTPVPLSFPWET